MYKKEFKKGPSKCLKCFGYDDVLCTKCDCALVGLLPDLLVGYYIVEIIRLYKQFYRNARNCFCFNI